MQPVAVADLEFAPARVWEHFQGPINAYLAGTGSRADAEVALDGYSRDIWGVPAERMTQAELDDETPERAEIWNQLVAAIKGR